MADPPEIYSSRFQTALDLFETGVGLMRENLRRKYPHCDEEETHSKLAAWLLHRPGAESGDCPGPPRRGL